MSILDSLSYDEKCFLFFVFLNILGALILFALNAKKPKKRMNKKDIQSDKDVILYTLDSLLMYNIITIEEYNRILTKSLPYFKGE